MIELVSLTCRYGDDVVLKDIDMQIPSHLSILGANGAGKSTLARAICSLGGYGGEIFINARNARELSRAEMAKIVSYVPSKLSLYDASMTVEEYVLLSRFAHKESFFDYSKADREIADTNIQMLGLGHLREHPVSSLSSGEAQLCLMASALTQQSGIIIFDEPTANLDPRNTKIVANHIKKLKETHDIILITHDLHLACYIGSPVAFIKDGGITLYESGFFDDEVLQKLYGVQFHSMAPKYD